MVTTAIASSSVNPRRGARRRTAAGVAAGVGSVGGSGRDTGTGRFHASLGPTVGSPPRRWRVGGDGRNRGGARRRFAKVCGATQKLQSVASVRGLLYAPLFMLRSEPRVSLQLALLSGALFLGGAGLAGCGKDKTEGSRPGPRGAAPPPSAESGTKPGACKEGGGQVNDPVAAPFFPRMSGEYCINPDGETRAFGEKAPKPMDGICGLFDGGCEVYKEHAVKRLVSVDYVDGGGGAGTVSAILSQFGSSEQAYAMFTHRVTSGEDPVRPDLPKRVDVGALAAMGTGSLYAWKGPYLLELAYVNTAESGDVSKLRQSSDKLLPPVAREIVGKLPGSTTPPPAVGKLPTDQQVPLGVTLVLKDALRTPGTGTAAVGFYKDGDRRYRVISFAKDDPDQAKDVLRTFAKQPGATEEKNLGEGAVRLMVQEPNGGPKAEWIVARQGATVLGVGDESFVLGPGSPLEKVALTKDEKIKKLRSILPGK